MVYKRYTYTYVYIYIYMYCVYNINIYVCIDMGSIYHIPSTNSFFPIETLASKSPSPTLPHHLPRRSRPCSRWLPREKRKHPVFQLQSLPWPKKMVLKEKLMKFKKKKHPTKNGNPGFCSSTMILFV